MKNPPKSKPTVRTANIYKSTRPRAAALEKKIRTAATRICLENGVECHSDIKTAILWAASGVKKMQTAGVKASLKKKLGHGSPKFWTKR